MAENRVIGRDGALPWRLPEDLRRFRALTTGHAVIMGRKTFESLGRPLPDRLNIVLSRSPSPALPPGVLHAKSLDAALALVPADKQAFIIGGADVYREALPLVAQIHLTLVQAQVPGDTRFPPLDPDQWQTMREELHSPDDRHPWPLTFRLLARRHPAP